jgi:hypothetical protein
VALGRGLANDADLMNSAAWNSYCDAVAKKVRAAGVFGEVSSAGGTVRCEALGTEDPAFFELAAAGGQVWVALKTPARYLSQSIEQDLVHSRDKIPDLLSEELIDRGYEGRTTLKFEHFRDENRQYCFRSLTPINVGDGASASEVEIGVTMLLAYEATFRPLGGMKPDDEGD